MVIPVTDPFPSIEAVNAAATGFVSSTIKASKPDCGLSLNDALVGELSNVPAS
jgi:hypothetical protein